jgi:hypothetical protein
MWCAGLGALTTWSNSDAAIATVIGISAVAGLLVGRWWLPIGALGVLTGLGLVLVLAGYRDTETELSPAALAIILYLYSVVLAVIPAAIGVGARRICLSLREVPDAIR